MCSAAAVSATRACSRSAASTGVPPSALDRLGQARAGHHRQHRPLGASPTGSGGSAVTRMWLSRPRPSAASMAAPASARWTCTCATVESPTSTTLWPSADSSADSAVPGRSALAPCSAYITSYSSGRWVVRRSRPRTVAGVGQRLGRRPAEHLDQRVEQQHVRLAARVRHPGRGQHGQLGRRTRQGLPGRACAASATGRASREPSPRAFSAASAAASATVMIVPSTGRATARRAAVAAVRSRSASWIPRRHLALVAQPAGDAGHHLGDDGAGVAVRRQDGPPHQRVDPIRGRPRPPRRRCRPWSAGRWSRCRSPRTGIDVHRVQRGGRVGRRRRPRAAARRRTSPTASSPAIRPSPARAQPYPPSVGPARSAIRPVLAPSGTLVRLPGRA